MKEKIDLIITQTINKLEREISKTREKVLSEKELEDIFTYYFIEALEEAEDDLMQTALWKQLSVKFHSDRLKNEKFKFKNYLEEQGLTRLPQQVLNSLNSLKLERPPKFLENSIGWFEFFAQLIGKIEELEEGSAERKKLEGQLRKQSFIMSGLYSLWSGLDRYFQPVRFLFKAIFFPVLILSVLATLLLFLSVFLINLILSIPKRFINFLISIATSNEFSRQIELYKTSYKEERLEEIKKLLPEDYAQQSNEELKRQPVVQILDETVTIEDILNNQVNQKVESNSFLYLKLLLLGFYHSLFKGISNESLGDQVLFVLSWPFRFILDIILFILMGLIELARQTVAITLILLPFVAEIIANVTLLFLLNLPRYVFFEIPRAIINYFQSSNDVSVEEDNLKEPRLLIEYKDNKSELEDTKKSGDFHPSPTPSLNNKRGKTDKDNEVEILENSTNLFDKQIT